MNNNLNREGAGIGFGTIVRLLAIVLGIMSATTMAQQAYSFRLHEDLLAALEIAGDLVGLVVAPIEVLLIRPGLKLMRELGFVVELGEHWRHVFVLLWLLFGSYARAMASNERPIATGYRWVVALLTALIGSVTAGSVPPDQIGSGLSLAFGIYMALDILQACINRKSPEWLRGLWLFAGALLSVGLFLVGIVPSKTQAFIILALTAFVGITAVLALLRGALLEQGPGETWWQGFRSSRATQFGTDVLAVLGGAAFIVWLGNALA